MQDKKLYTNVDMLIGENVLIAINMMTLKIYISGQLEKVVIIGFVMPNTIEKENKD